MTAKTDSAAPLGAERALVVRPLTAQDQRRDPGARLAEAVGLVEALGLAVAAARCAPIRRMTPATLFGQGQVASLTEEVAASGAGVVVIDDRLTPVQQRNLERALNAKVIDREGLILEIFGLRAQTREGKLQVELARLGYERSRLVRTWTHLERQRGGLGKTGGPGETQIELDRRLIADRIVKLRRHLEEVKRTRRLQRSQRLRAGLATVALVGYTNAGKSTLFNRLTDAGVLAKDMPFATLDPTARLVRLPSGGEAVFSDTVGFITDLPTELVAAFRATLEAVSEADVLIHVRDIADPETEAQREDVLAVLAQIGAGGAHQTVLEALNKIDRLDADAQAALRARTAADAATVPISAVTGQGVEALLRQVEAAAYGPRQRVQLFLDPADGRTRAWIAARGVIVCEDIAPDGRLRLTAELPAAEAARLAQRPGQALAAE